MLCGHASTLLGFTQQQSPRKPKGVNDEAWCGVVWSVAFCLAAWGAPAWAQLSNDVVKIGVATDMASLYSDINGPGAVVATQMAIDDFGGSILGKKIELLTGDIQNKADVAATLAGRWYDSEN